MSACDVWCWMHLVESYKCSVWPHSIFGTISIISELQDCCILCTSDQGIWIVNNSKWAKYTAFYMNILLYNSSISVDHQVFHAGTPLLQTSFASGRSRPYPFNCAGCRDDAKIIRSIPKTVWHYMQTYIKYSNHSRFLLLEIQSWNVTLIEFMNKE